MNVMRIVMRMASLHRQPNRPFWFAAYTDSEGVRRFRSTGTPDKKQAQVIADAWTRATRTARGKRLTPEEAREIIAGGVADIYNGATKQQYPTNTIRQWINQWLDGKKIEAEPSTAERYGFVTRSFLAHLGDAANNDLVTLRGDEIERYLHAEAKARSRATANFSLKVLRGCLGSALKRGLVSTNQASAVDILKTRKEKKRRPLTMEEIRKVLALVEDSEWKGLILCGLFTGQRLGDLAKMRWEQIDVVKGTLSLVTQKTDRRLEIPMAPDLQAHFETLSTPDDPMAPVFPKSEKIYKKNRSTLSRQFLELLAQAGLVARKDHTGQGKSRSAGRDISPVSFHSLRHSAVSFLKAAGVTEAIAMDLVGHESPLISRHYTTLDLEAKRTAVDKLPRIGK